MAIGAILSTLLAIVMIGNAKSKKKQKEIKKDLRSNEKAIAEARIKQAKLNSERKDISSQIKKGAKDINEAKQNKPKIKKKSADEAAKSIKNRLN